MKTKVELAEDAFNEMRINGITVEPDNEDIVLFLTRLEDFMSELNLDLNFNFEDSPDPNSISGLPNYANFPIAAALALRMAPAYGKIREDYTNTVSGAMSGLRARATIVRRVNYPSRQPIGSGNNIIYPRYQFFPVASEAPNTIDTKNIELGNKQTFTFDFTPYFDDGVTILSYTEAHESGITINSQSFVDNVISVTLTTTIDGWQTIKFKVTGTDGSIINKTMNFNVTQGDAVEANV